MARAYREVAAELRRRIEAGEYGPKTPLPSERALEQEFDVHRATVRRALSVLATEGILNRSPGQRAFIRPSSPEVGGVGLYVGGPTDPYARALIAHGLTDVFSELSAPHYIVWSDSAAYGIRANEMEEPVERLSALVLWPPRLPDVPRLRLAKSRMPVVLIDLRVPGFESDFVGFQDFEAGYRAAQHLYEIGHRRVTFIGDVVPETAQFRRSGIRQFCQESGMEMVWPFAAGSGPLGHLPDPLQRALVEMPRTQWPTAAICTNDETAAVIISFLARYGMRVPDDLALMGFGNAQPELLSALGLTTMEQPYIEVGRETGRLIIDRLGDLSPSAECLEIRLPMRLVIRNSCGASETVSTEV